MYTWCECCHLVGTETEAKFLVELLTSLAVLLQSSSEPFDGVQGLGSRTMVLFEKAALDLCC